MKKSIGILAAVLFSASVYSQPYSGPDPGQTGNPGGDNIRSRQSESGAPATSQFGSQQSSEAGSFSTSSTSDSTRSFNDDSGLAKELSQGTQSPTVTENQGLSLDDQDAANVLRQSDDPDLANRNNEQRAREQGLAGNSDIYSDFSARKGSDEEPDMIYEEWYLFGPIQSDQSESVGAPAESESGSSSSSVENPGSSGELDNSDPQSRYDADVQESGELNDSRIYNGTDYWRDNSGAPAASQSGSSKSHRDHCDGDKDSSGGPGESVSGSGSLKDQDNEPRAHKDQDSSDRYEPGSSSASPASDQSEGSAASGDTSSSKSSDDSYSRNQSLNHSENRDYPESSTTTPDL